MTEWLSKHSKLSVLQNCYNLKYLFKKKNKINIFTFKKNFYLIIEK